MLKLSMSDGTEVALQGERLSIGRDQNNDLVLADNSVSGFHCAIVRESNGYDVVDLGSANGTRVNGKLIDVRQPLTAWDIVTVGDVEMELADAGARRPTQVVTMPDCGSAYLEPVGNEPQAVRMHVAATVRVGRDADNDLHLDLPSVSRCHARIEMTAGGYELEDLGSTNGTSVNGKKITKHTLVDGDRIVFGSVEYVFRTPKKTQVVTQLHSSFSSGATQMIVRPTEVTIRDARELVREDERPESTPSGQGISVPPRDLAWRYFSFNGRLPRLPYLYGILGLVLAIIVLNMGAAMMLGPKLQQPFSREARLFSVIQFVLLAWPVMALNVKRVQDMAWPWFVPALFLIVSGIMPFLDMRSAVVVNVVFGIGLANLLFMLVLLFRKGTAGSNKYGSVYSVRG